MIQENTLLLAYYQRYSWLPNTSTKPSNRLLRSSTSYLKNTNSHQRRMETWIEHFPRHKHSLFSLFSEHSVPTLEYSSPWHAGHPSLLFLVFCIPYDLYESISRSKMSSEIDLPRLMCTTLSRIQISSVVYTDILKKRKIQSPHGVSVEFCNKQYGVQWKAVNAEHLQACSEQQHRP